MDALGGETPTRLEWALLPNPNPAGLNQEVSFSVQLLTGLINGIPDKDIYFYANGVKLNTEPRKTTSTFPQGFAGWIQSFDVAGTYQIKAVFEGDNEYAASESTEKTLEVTDLPQNTPWGKIISQTPECSEETPCSAEEGHEVEFTVGIKNIGNVKGKFLMYLFDDTTGELIETEPCVGIPFTEEWICNWKDMNPGEEYENTLDTKWSAFLAMPDYDWPLRIEVREISREFAAEPDDVKRFTMHVGGPGGHILILDEIPKTLYVGEEYVFTGELSQSGVAVANAQIRIYDKDLLWGDLIAEGMTDENGEFSITWLIEDLDVYGDLEIYAEHLQSGTKSSIQKITISKRYDTTKLLLYSGVAIGLYVGGGIVGGIGEDVKGVPMKPIGTGLKLVALLPGGLAIYEGYKIVKEKIPWWGG